MTWTVITLGTAAVSSGATFQQVFPITATAGSLVAVGVAFQSGGTSSITGFTVTDSASNTYATVHAVAAPSGTLGWLGVAFCVLANALSSGVITITRVGSGNITKASIAVFSLAGGTGSEDAAVLASTAGTSAFPTLTGSAASQPGDLVLALDAMWPASSTTYTEDAADGWTSLVNNLKPGNTSVALGVAWQANSGAAGLRHRPTYSASQPWAEMQLAFAPLVAVALGGTATIQSKGTAAASYSLSLAGRAASMAKANASGTYGASLLTRATIATFGRATPSYLARVAGQLSAGLKGAAGIAPTSIVFDPDYALLALPRTDALAAPQRTDALPAPTLIESFLAD